MGVVAASTALWKELAGATIAAYYGAAAIPGSLLRAGQCT